MRPFVATSAEEFAPVISADGGLLAYVSDESGTGEVYVQPIPGPGVRVQVSVNGGGEPIWSPKGTTLFYRSADRVMAAELGGAGLRVQRRDSLFSDVFNRGGTRRNWDIFPSGREFLMLRTVGAATTVHVVLNWPQLPKLQRGTDAAR